MWKRLNSNKMCEQFSYKEVLLYIYKFIILNTNINIHDFMQRNLIFKFDDIVKFNSIQFIHEVSIINYRLICKSDLLKIKIIVIGDVRGFWSIKCITRYNSKYSVNIEY